jgi:hypothetical protein
MLMRMMENFSGCRVLSYCVMSNHFHILLEVPPMPVGGLSDAELLKRLGVFYGENFVKSVADELLAARTEGGVDGGNPERVAEIHGRFTKRMHDLSDFMKTLLQRFTRWFNRTHNRTGTLWEERFKSVIVESGTAARTIAAMARRLAAAHEEMGRRRGKGWCGRSHRILTLALMRENGRRFRGGIGG